ncbi:MAG: sulfotransferase, partial [Myxococcota bacterium]
MSTADEKLGEGPSGQVAADPRLRRLEMLFYVVGSSKCGTTWVNRYFQSHPETHIPTVREINYWNSLEPDARAERLSHQQMELANFDRTSWWKRYVRRAKARRLMLAFERMYSTPDPSHRHYADVLFSGARAPKVIGDVSPGYTSVSQDTYREMSRVGGQTRFVLLMRDPVDRLHSACRHRLRKSKEGLAVTEENVLNLVDRHLERGALGRSMAYHETLSILEQAVPSKDILPLFYETLFTEETIRRLCDFIGVGYHEGDF